jgi:MFS family permease
MAEVKGRGWVFLLCLFTAASLMEVSAAGSAQAFLPLFIERELGVPTEDVPRWTGVLAAAPLMVAAPLATIWGVLADRYGGKVVILRSFVLEMFVFLLASLSQNVWQLLGIRLAQGLTWGGNAIIVGLLADLVPSRRVGFAIGVTQMAFPVGNAIGPLVGSGLIELLGLRGMYGVYAALCGTAFLLVLLGFREPPRVRDHSRSVMGQVATVGGVAWRTPSIRLAFILFAMFSGGWSLVVPFVPVLIARLYTGDNVARAIGLTLAAFGAVAAIAAPLAGRLTDRVGPARLVTGTMLGMLIMACGLVFAQTPEQVAIMLLVGAVPFGANNTALYAHLVRHTPREHMSAIMSVTPLSRTAAMLVAPLVGAVIAGVSLQGVFVAAMVLYATAVVLSLVLARYPTPAARAEAAEP